MLFKKLSVISLATLCLTSCLPALAADIRIAMHDTATEQPVGNITVTQTKYGLLFTPDLHNLSPGMHGLHIHEHPSCGNKGMDAGSHLDPQETGKHLGPYNDEGHLGDLPVITVAANGTATVPVLAPRLHSLNGLRKHSLMLHEGGDNYSDEPAKLGGGGGRMVCGVIE